MSPEDQKRILGYFIEEAKDHLNTIEQGLLNLGGTVADPEMMNEVFRAAHSVKGGAAMLGLNSISRTSHRMEDFFKIMKEAKLQPDRSLESTLLQIFDGLQEQLEQIQSPFGLTDDQAQEIMAQLEPVFVQAESHIQELVAAAPAAPTSPPVTAPAPRPVTASVHPETSALQLVFRSDIPALLRDILTAFKQSDSRVSRQELGRLCQRLHSLGEQFELDRWCALTQTIEQAIANPNQTYRTLAPVVIKDLKQAQDQVLAGALDQVCASAGLQNLLPPPAVDLPLGSEDDSILDDLLAEALNDGSEDADLAALFATAEEGDDADLALIENDWLGQLDLDAADNITDTGLESVLGSWDAPPEPAVLSGQDSDGPAVGAAELNSLADLFEADAESLAEMWEDDDLPEMALAELGLEVDDTSNATDAEFADLLLDDADTGATADSAIDDMASLFGYDLDAAAALEPDSTAEAEPTASFLDLPEVDSAPSATSTAVADALDDFLTESAVAPEVAIEPADAAGDDFFSLNRTTAARGPESGLGEGLEDFFDPVDQGSIDDDDAQTMPEFNFDGEQVDDPFGDLALTDNGFASPLTPAADLDLAQADLDSATSVAGATPETFDFDDLDLPWDDDTVEAETPMASVDNLVEDNRVDFGEMADITRVPETPATTSADLFFATDHDIASAEAPVTSASGLDNNFPTADRPELAASFPELDDGFDELEALLGEDPPEEAPRGVSGLTNGSGPAEFAVPAGVPNVAPSVDPSPPAAVALPTNGDEDGFDDLEKLLEEADQLGGSAPSLSGRRATMPTARRSTRRASSTADQTMRVSVGHLDNLSNLVGELVVNRNSLEQDQERLRQFLDNLLHQVSQLNDVGQRMRDLYERSLLESSLIANRQAFALRGADRSGSNHATGATFDALEMDRFTGFHTLSQEMIELIVRVREASSDIEFTIDSTDQIARQFRQVTTQLQEGLNKARMVAFGQTADRLPRAVRDISLQCGKESNLVVEGRDTLIDKMILERLYDPMTHLVNNAITHGIESPEERIATGKTREGTITVRAFYQGNQTVIYIADNGGGINTAVVKAKALKQGLITPAEAQTMTEIEVYDLLFLPGFSTREQADNFSGRGVGMDVVRTALADIRGSITIESEVGKGTSFTIRLPLTLSITKALSCVNNQARIAFPMDGVEDMFDVPKERIQTDAQGHSCILWRDTLLPFRPLGELLHFNRSLGRGRVYGGPQDEGVVSIVVLRSASAFIALQVDQVIGEQEIVIKQLEGPVPKPMGIAGATVLGDGRVMPIADVLELIDLASGRVRRDVSTSLWTQAGADEPEEAIAQNDPTVLIVDDSITVRELLSMSFNKVGYRVEQARDGQEAWEKLRSGLPCDLVFCDIEMPRMDGLELLSRIQKDEELNQIPIAMLTSRGADRHRQMAVDMGAKGYFTKPYLEEMLLDAAQRMLKGENMIAKKASKAVE